MAQLDPKSTDREPETGDSGSAAAAPLLRAERLVKEFRSGDAVLRILKGVDLDIRRGECLAIVGPSGAGKSTLLHALGFLDRPTTGDVVYDGRMRASALGEAQYAEVRNHHIGFVFQFHHLLPDLTAEENVLVPLMIRHSVGAWMKAGREARRRSKDLLVRLGLGERLHHRPDQLSGGERQRVAIARALAADPDALLCDEPTGNLDTATSREIQDRLFSLNRDDGKALVVVTHDEAIARRAHRVIRLVDGRIA